MVRSYIFFIICYLSFSLGGLLIAHFTGSVAQGKAFGVGIMFCFLLWFIFRYEYENKYLKEES